MMVFFVLHAALFVAYDIGPHYRAMAACSLACAGASCLALIFLDATFIHICMGPAVLFTAIMAERVYWGLTLETYSVKKARKVLVALVFASMLFNLVAFAEFRGARVLKLTVLPTVCAALLLEVVHPCRRLTRMAY